MSNRAKAGAAGSQFMSEDTLAVGAQASLARCPVRFSALTTEKELQLTGVQRYHSVGPWIHLPLFISRL